jgi:hypothetical protein
MADNGTPGEIVGSLALKPQVIPALPDKLPVLTISQDKFVELTGVVIDNFEGGYYHPDMKKNFKPSDQKKFGDSGETMYGLDRKHGAALAKYDEWNVFWETVDLLKAKYPNEWKYNAKNMEGAASLKTYAAKIMFKWFSYLAGKYILISSMDEIANDDRLVIHFSYASWNGEGWFERYAKALNAAIKLYEGNKEAIFTTAIKARTESSNKVIAQQGANMMSLFKKLGLV